MDIVYKKVNAQITPEALAKLKQKKIIFESRSEEHTSELQSPEAISYAVFCLKKKKKKK